MSQRYPCPNPTCSHEFAPADLTGVASVTCPQCGMMIQLRAAAPSPTAPTVLAPAMQPPADALVTPPTPAARIVRVQRRRGSRDLLTYTMVIGGFLLLVAAGFVVLYIRDRGGVGKLLSGKGGFKNSDFNFSFNPGLAGWEDNPAMKEKLKVSQLALQRHEGQAVFALDVIDFKDHTPTVRELDDQARAKLRALFPKNLETDPPAGAASAEAEPVAGRPAQRVAFHGETSERAFAGEVVYFGDQGLGYWLYTYASEAEAKGLATEFQQLRQGLVLLGERAEWKRVQQRRTVFTGNKIKGFEIADVSGRWQQEAEPAAHDPQADLVLTARDPAFPKRPTLGAELIVMSLTAGKNPVETARAHILAKHEREGFPGTKIGDSYAEGEGPKERVGEAVGRLVRWRVDNGGGRLRFAVVGIVPRGETVLVLYGDCPWERRVNWEAQLLQVIESLRLTE